MGRPVFSILLVAVDGSELTERIAHYAMRFPSETILHFVCALDPRDFMTPVTAAVYGMAEEQSVARAAAQRLIDGCVAEATAGGHESHGHVVDAEPVDAIIDLSAELEADAIVMASHGRGGFARLTLGSVCEGVARRASVPILLVPAGPAEVDPNRHLQQLFQGT